MSLNVLERKQLIKSVSDIKEIIDCVETYGLTVVKIGIGQEYKSINAWKAATGKSNINLSQNIIIELKDTKLEITTRYYKRYYKYGTPCTYIFDLNDEDIFIQSGLDCFKEFSRYYKIPKAKDYKWDRLEKYFDEETGKYTCSAKPVLDYNKEFEKKPLENCYEYDLNSAYANTLLEKIPDLYHPVIANYPDLVKVEKDEIGFLLDDNLTLVESGYADIKFKLIETPAKLKEFLYKWYNIKKNTTGVEKLLAKAMLNLPIGYCQRYNPFLRSYVVNKCNKVIKKLINKTTLFWNTDAIFCTEKQELNIGKEIGQFKEIKCDKLVYVGNTYQVNDDDPTYRGISKSWFKAFEKKNNRRYDLLKDYDAKIERINYYDFNWNTLELEINPIWEN